MTADRPDPHLFAARLRRDLAAHGFTVLAVTIDPSTDGACVVYLHGAAGTEHQARAFAFLTQPGEDLDVSVSEQTSSILLVRRRPATRD